ncbi:UDP-N-acetylmuramoyl-L-alanine--D-glutamate ligase [Sphingomonas sp. gentR]|uniref:UDP-N-acetylmuramoyl-L-alanine--D-glutamate ligase n=1 Tax=unclassified Sphingomonas TaxID=196159 RepID=UPI000972BBC3|nr:UDP-N-acetylmuramoyl-L-alanine--D-glutamate ligase [Sphingomonas sp. LK11]APX66824.1 UDP-N-acetylmuramoylalanine--D-glutamate ligase [Sphingomonas sp. LK11]
MIVSRDWAGKRYAVLGLARSGAATVSALLAGGASVVAWDSDPAKREAFAAHDRLSIAPLDDLSGFDALVVSPGVPLNTHPLAAAARAAGVPVIGDIELFAQARRNLPPHKVVGITGTNGKSTTTALVHHILKTAGVPTLMGGNIGLPILGQAPLPEGGVYVLELSSYQIDLTQSLDCDVAVLLNITPDHLDRYDGFAGYAASKARLFAMQSAGHVAVVGTGDEASAHIAQGLAGRTDDLVTIATSGIDQSRWPALQGPHNAQNAQAAIAVARALGIAEDAIEAGLRTYASLPHRMQHVATRNGVAFVNDSKATNPESTAPALAAFPRVHWIVGGKRKGDDLDACTPHLGHVVAAYTIGEAAPLFFDLLKDKVPVVDQSGTLEAAVAHAAAAAQPGDTVLLSPACASFDQFRDYEARGDAFRAVVEALA